MKHKSIIVILTIILFTGPLFAKISERELHNYRAAFLTKIIKDNPDYAKYIHICMDGIIPQGNAGMRLLDKLGLFMYDMKQNKISINKTRFFYNKGIFFIMIVLVDEEGQMYNLYLEYNYSWTKRCLLKNAYFSLVFSKKQKKILDFFGNRQ